MFDLDRLLGIIVDGRYRLTRQIGRGSFGVVFAAEEYVLGHAVSQVAVKLILAEEEWERDSFLREIRGLATLAHPQIIAYRVAGEEEDGLLGGTLFLVTELAERSLADAVRAAGTLPDQDARRVAADMAAALAYVHAREVIHRDVKPANVLQVGERWKLSDFGLVRAAQGAMVRGTGMAGTPAYLAPEAAFHQQYGPATDLYALGVTLLECLTGHVAHEGHNRQEILNNLAVHPPSIPPDLPGPWKTLLHRCLERDPLARPRAEEIPELLGVSTPRTPDARPEPAGDVAVAGPGRDGAAMVRVPAGMFLMGFADGREDERPEHQVTLPAFDIDRAPVTNALYARFLNDAGRLKDDGGHDYLFLNESLQLECGGGGWRAPPGWVQHPLGWGD